MAADPLPPTDAAPLPPSGVDPIELPGTADDVAPADALSENFRAVRDSTPSPGGSDIAADDAGATAMAEKLGKAAQKS